MKSFKMRKKHIIFTICITAIILLSSIFTHHVAEAATYVSYDSSYATWNVEIANDSIVIHTYDKTRTSSTAYKTLGFTVSRCKIGQEELINGTASEWVAIDLADITEEPEQVITTDNKLFTHTQWSFPLQKVYEEAVRLGFTDWANEIKAYYIDKTATDNIVYLKFDSIMCVVEYTDTYPDGLFSGEYDCRNRRVWSGTCYTNTPLESNLPENQKNPYVLQHARGWANPAPIAHHYNRYLPESNPSLPAGGVPGGVPGGTLSAPVSLYETKNYSTIYNISKAIPSGEAVTNAVSASSINGSIGVSTQTATQTYSVTNRYYRMVPTIEYEYQYVGTINVYEHKGFSYPYVGSRDSYDLVYVSPSINYVPSGSGDYKATPSGIVYVGGGKGNLRRVVVHKGDYNSSDVYVGAGNGDYKRNPKRVMNGDYNADHQYVGPGNGEYTQRGNGEYIKISNGAWSYVGPGNGEYNAEGVYVGYGRGSYIESPASTYHYVGANRGNYSMRTVNRGDSKQLTANTYQYLGPMQGTYYRKEVEGDLYHEEEITTKTFTFTASVQYQYINSVNLEVIDSMSVYNTAFPGGVINYPKSSLSNTNVTATLLLRSASAAASGRTWDTISNGTNLAGYNFSPNTSHYSFPSVSLYANKSVQMPYNYTTAQLQAQIDADARAIRDSIGNNSKSSNDGFTLNDNGSSIVFMQNTECTGATITDGVNTWNYGNQAATSSYRYGANGQTIDSYISNLNATRATSNRTVTIPVQTQNGDHPTGMTATYGNLFGTGTNTYSAGKNYGYADSIYAHVMSDGVLSEHNGGDPNDGYPIRVHTPVLSPFEIVFNDLTPAVETTQLVTTQLNSSSEYQLLLDRSYYVKWDNNLWLSNIYGDVNYGDVFDRYVAKKEIRFPFAVVYNGKLYEVNASGYTPWITVLRPDDYTDAWDSGVDISKYESNNHWKMTPFYIPSFADEGGWPGNDKYIEVAVYAYNFTGTDIADDDENSVNIIITNGAVSDYIATTKKQTQLSGWMYDFTIVGTSNKSIYTGEDLTSKNVYDKIGNLSLAELKFELKSGTTNRLGTPNIRYLSDGTVNNAWNILQTIPMRNGQSFAFNNLGQVWKGQTFAYTIKTISNLNGNNDSLRITPSFKYVNSAGEVLDESAGEFKMYEVTDTSIKEFNPSDISIADGNFISLSSDIFDQSYYDTSDMYGNQQLGDWVTASVNKENANNSAIGYYSTVTKQEFMTRPILSYNLNSIYIPHYLRYMSGEYEQLEMNDGKSYDRTTGTTTLKTYWNTITNYTSATEERFKTSMQQWQSAYVVPSNVYIVDTRSVGGSSFDIYSYIDSQDHFSWEDCPIAIKDEGQLIVGFDIIAYRDGTPYLEYEGGNNMWQTESSTETPPTIEEDDVAIIDMERSITDYYEPAIHNIN